MLILLLFLLGLIIGSFLNVCIYRLPLNQSLIRPPSHCVICQRQLPVKDLLPVISFLFLRGRCRFCAALISRRYISVELLTGILFSWCFSVFGIAFTGIKALIFSVFLICITFIDLDHQLILDKVLVWFAACGTISGLVDHAVSLGDMAAAALIGGGVLLVIAVVTKGGMGGGDIKFVAALGLWLGLKLTMLAIFLAFLIAGVGGAVLMIARLKGRKDFIPFGPFIAIGAFISFLYGEQLTNWYFTTFNGI